MSFKTTPKGNQKVVELGVKTVLKVRFIDTQKGSQKLIETVMKMGLQSKYSGPQPTFDDCRKDSGSTGENGTQVKPVLLAVKIFAVYVLLRYEIKVINKI